MTTPSEGMEYPVMDAVLGWLNRLFRRRRFFLLVAAAVSVSLVTYGVVRRRYVSEIAFTPTSSGPALSSLASLASQFGVNASILSGNQPTLDFYAALVQSRELLDSVAVADYRFATARQGTDTLAGNLLDLYGIKGDTPVERLQHGVRRLQEDVTVDEDQTSGIVTVRVKAPWPDLAEAISAQIFRLVNEFNISTRQTQAGLERRFIDARLGTVEGDLHHAEDSLRSFLETNRTFQTSPRLVFEQQRLQRTVDLRQQVFTTLSQAAEQAKIDEVRNTPVITSVAGSSGSALPAHSLPVIVLLGLLVGALLGIGSALAVDVLQAEARHRAPQREEFLQHLRELRVGRLLVRCARFLMQV